MAEAATWNQPYDAGTVAYNQNVTSSYVFCALADEADGRLRSLTLSIAGATAGVLGLTNAQGFGFYVASVVLVNALILVLNARMQPSDYFILSGPTSTDPAEELAAANTAKERAPKTPIESAWELGKFIVLQGAQDNLLSFILWWTFFYAIVHVYD